ncbi:MAG: PP2C family protein-serine/threonine phosphatase [Thermoanaerobaculia bacterium]
MREPYRKTLTWLIVLVASAAVCAWAFPRAFPFFPANWKVSRVEAEKIALDELRLLGEMPQDPYVVAQMQDEAGLEYRLIQASRAGQMAIVRDSALDKRILCWQVTVYAPQAQPRDWSYQAEIAFDGTVLSLVKGFKATDPSGALSEADALSRANALLVERGFDPAKFVAPEVKNKDFDKRTDRVVRYADRESPLSTRLRSGMEVTFAGDQLASFGTYVEDVKPDEITQLLQPINLFGNISFFSTFLILPLVAPIFLKRYHEGELGVRRGVQILLLILGLGVVLMAQVSAGATQGSNFGILSRQQTTWVWGGQMIILFFLPMGIAALLSWSVGESLCREGWGSKLAAFDALFQKQWNNRTVALASLRGYAAGFAIAAAIFASLIPLAHFGGIAPISYQFGPFWQHARWPSFALILFLVIFSIYTTLFGRLFLLPWLTRKLGKIFGGLLAALATSFVFFAPIIALPMTMGTPIWILNSLATVVLFLTTDLLTTILASFTSAAVLSIFPFVFATDPVLQVHGWIGVLAGAVPLILTARHLVSDRTFVYRYEDVPPHVRRIAQRERQRVELETARNIQSSILPQLPPQLNGVELSHVYLPATEVGGDFYDVLALEDGRLAVAVGDVAGHGVSSGLVMSMAKSALAVQVTFNPEVAAVFATLNRMVFQSARKRLLATLCYALIDPVRREMRFASAGHLFPYRISKLGKVESLESVAYPLGVRETIEIDSHTAKLEAGDIIFLCSDGVVEARKEGSDEHFGFDRLEQVLANFGGHGASVVRDKVLAALDAFTQGAEREDDLTVLVLRMP